MGSERLFVRTARSTRTWPAPDARTSAFFEAEPLAALHSHVRKVRWGHESIAAPVDELIVPDGALHLIVVLPGGGARPYGLAVGASTAPNVVHLAGDIRHVELELDAGGSLALFGAPARALEGQAVPLEDLWGDAAWCSDSGWRRKSPTRAASTSPRRSSPNGRGTSPPPRS